MNLRSWQRKARQRELQQQELPQALRQPRQRRRSIVFLHHNYYHFYYLAKALRKRGWDAITVSIENPALPQQRFYHGEDLVLFDLDYPRFMQNVDKFLDEAMERFDMMHFSGDGCLSFRPHFWHDDAPADIVRWKESGKKIGYTTSGCNSAVSQSAVIRWSRAAGHEPICERCAWKKAPDVCSDERNIAWGLKVSEFADLICSETVPALDFLSSSPKVVREPLTIALDTEVWTLNFEIPPELRLKAESDEIVIYHAVGNYEARTSGGSDPKGSSAAVEAIERLKREGHRIHFVFRTDLRSVDVRFVQSQADIVVDQLRYGRYGATARESMMLGKPVICFVNPFEHDPADELPCLKEVPVVSATPDTVYAVLKDLVVDRARRLSLGEQGRRYALKWHSADACAERFEKVYDNLMDGRPLLEGLNQK